MTITVRDGYRLIRVPAVTDKDGLTVGDSRGLRAAKTLLRECRRGFLERIRPKPFSPFQPFRTRWVAVR